jgi:uncharacterized repeat protein (TIGR02543 family)
MLGKLTGRLKGARLALAGGLAVVLVASILTVGPETAAFAASSSISEAATFPVNNEASGLSTLSIDPQNVGDLVILLTQIHSQSITVNTVSSAKTGAWHLADRYVDPINNVITEEVWWSVAASTGADTVTATFSGDVSSLTPELVADSFTTSSGATWSAETGLNVGNAAPSGTTITFPTLTSNGHPNQLYWGYAQDASTVVPGNTTDFAYSSTLAGNLVVSDATLSSNTPYAPTATSTTSATNTSIGVIFDATPTVTFNGNGSDGGSSMSPEAATLSTPLTSNTFTRTNYTFAGWNTAANGSGTVYADGAPYPFGAGAGATLYAQWTANSTPPPPPPAPATPTVTFNGNGSDGGSMSPEVDNAPTALTSNAFTRTDYTFAGWNTAANGSGTSYANGATYPFTAGATLYAQWTANPHTVTFNGNGATSGSINPEVDNAPTALTSNAFTRTNSTFAGWNTAANGSGTRYANGATYPFTADATLYAQWVANAHTVTFIGNGANHGSMKSEVANAPTKLTPNAFSRTHYTFAGWNTAANGTGTKYANGATYPFTADLRLYAQWRMIPIPAPHATRLIGTISAGTTHVVVIVGTAFTGTSRVTSDAPGTTVRILHVTNTQIEVRVTVKKGTPRGTHMLKIVLYNGKSCTIGYVSR